MTQFYDGLEKGNHQPFWSYIKHKRHINPIYAPTDDVLSIGSA